MTGSEERTDAIKVVELSLRLGDLPRKVDTYHAILQKFERGLHREDTLYIGDTRLVRVKGSPVGSFRL